MATYFHSLYATLKTFLILIFDKIFNTYTYDPTIIAGWVHAISMQSEDEQLHVYFSIWSCGLVSNSSALDNFLLIPFTELLFHYLSETYWLRDILVAYISTVGRIYAFVWILILCQMNVQMFQFYSRLI